MEDAWTRDDDTYECLQLEQRLWETEEDLRGCMQECNQLELWLREADDEINFSRNKILEIVEVTWHAPLCITSRAILAGKCCNEATAAKHPRVNFPLGRD